MNEQMDFPNTFDEFAKHHQIVDKDEHYSNGIEYIPVFRVKQWLEQQITVKEYRQRMIQAFHNADHDELIAVCVLPSEKEFEHLEWLLKNHYKKEPCDDVISRQAVLDCLTATNLKKFDFILDARDKIKNLPPVTPQPKMGKWIKSRDSYGNNHFTCPFCEHDIATKGDTWEDNYCSNCGAKLDEVKDGNK